MGAEEIFDFYKSRAQAYGVFQYLKLGHKVHKAVWNDQLGRWKLEIEDLVSKQMFSDEAEVLINAGGFLKFVLVINPAVQGELTWTKQVEMA